MTLQTVTIFGGSGFIGRYLVRRLAKLNYRVRVAVRYPDRASFLKPMGDVGQITPVAADIRNANSVARAVAGADIVINLVGILFESGNRRFDDVHHLAAGEVARAAAAAGAARFVHMSAIGADANSDSDYARSKAAGEAAVREHFSSATIARASVVFGPEDDFLNRFGQMSTIAPAMPLLGGGETRFQPVYVGDLAEAICRIIQEPDAQGESFEFGGPAIYSFKELMQYVVAQTGRFCLLLPVPFEIGKIMGAVLQWLPKPPLTADQVRLLMVDNVADTSLPGLAELGINPTSMESVAPSYLARYRRGGQLQASRFG